MSLIIRKPIGSDIPQDELRQNEGCSWGMMWTEPVQSHRRGVETLHGLTVDVLLLMLQPLTGRTVYTFQRKHQTGSMSVAMAQPHPLFRRSWGNAFDCWMMFHGDEAALGFQPDRYASGAYYLSIWLRELMQCYGSGWADRCRQDVLDRIGTGKLVILYGSGRELIFNRDTEPALWNAGGWWYSCPPKLGVPIGPQWRGRDLYNAEVER